MSSKYLILLFLVSGLGFTCQSFEKVEVSKAEILLQKAIAKAGGLENWNNLQALHFQKYFALYQEDGSIEQETLQQHDYIFSPKQQINIGWRKDSLNHKIVSQNGVIKKTINSQPDQEANLQSLENSILSATFVISIPFKLLDEGATISYDGLDTLENNQVVEVLKVSYAPEKYEHHSTPDIWWHYYDINDQKQLGYMVQHDDHFSYVKNLSFTEVDGFIFPRDRESYRVDRNRNILYLRAKYLYEDFVTK